MSPGQFSVMFFPATQNWCNVGDYVDILNLFLAFISIIGNFVVSVDFLVYVDFLDAGDVGHFSDIATLSPLHLIEHCPF